MFFIICNHYSNNYHPRYYKFSHLCNSHVIFLLLIFICYRLSLWVFPISSKTATHSINRTCDNKQTLALFFFLFSTHTEKNVMFLKKNKSPRIRRRWFISIAMNRTEWEQIKWKIAEKNLRPHTPTCTQIADEANWKIKLQRHL